MKRKRRYLVSAWVPVIAWMLLIFGASSDLGSAEHTARFLIPFLHWINPEISAAGIEFAQLLVRKAAHLTEYAVLGVFLLRALLAGARSTFARQALLAFVLAGLYASTDEFHQSFVGSRTSSVKDVMIDCCGALLGVAAYRLLAMRAAPAPLGTPTT